MQLGTIKPAANTVAAYRRDLEGVARRIAADAEVGVLHLDHRSKVALRAALPSWADRHGRVPSAPRRRMSLHTQSHSRRRHLPDDRDHGCPT